VNADFGERPPNAVIGGTNSTESLFVCRSPGGGGDISRAGQLSWQGCAAVMGATTQVYKHYQVLVNVDGSARLEWQDWKQFTALPQGAVNVANDVYVAREVANAALHNYLGGLYLQEQYGLIVLPPTGRKLTIGQLLVEHEPVMYELVSFKPDRLRSVQSTDVTLDPPIVLAKAPSSYVGMVVNYTHWDELYFGRGHNIPTGSSVVLHFSNGTRLHFKWGLPKREAKVTKMRVGGGPHIVPPNSRVSANVIATRVERQWDYFATLSAHYRDGAILMRPVKGVFRQVTLHHLRPVYTIPAVLEEESPKTTSVIASSTTAAGPLMGNGQLTNFEPGHDKGSLIFHPSKVSRTRDNLFATSACLVLCSLITGKLTSSSQI
jgi:hypothetical protein